MKFAGEHADHYRTIKQTPRIALVGEGLQQVKFGTISGIVVGTGRISVNTALSPFAPYQTKTAILATLGLADATIASFMKVSKKTTMSHMRVLFKKTGTADRTALARQFFESGTYTIEKAGACLALKEHEQPAVEQLSYGLSRDQAGKNCHVAGGTVKTYLQTIQERTGWQGQEEIVLASFVGGGIGKFALQATEVRLPPEPHRQDIYIT